MQSMHSLLGTFVTLNAVDQVTTWYGLSHGGEEGNPVFARLFATIGFGPATVVKMMFAVGLAVLLMDLVRRRPGLLPVAKAGVAALCVVYILAVTCNVLGA